MNLGLSLTEATLQKKGFGYLIPSSEGAGMLGCVFDSSVFPEQDDRPWITRLTVMLGGAHFPEVTALTDDELADLAIKRIVEQLSVSQTRQILKKPKVVISGIAREGIPQYEVGHQAKVEKVLSLVRDWSDERLLLLGTSFRGVGVADSVASSRRLAIDFHKDINAKIRAS